MTHGNSSPPADPMTASYSTVEVDELSPPSIKVPTSQYAKPIRYLGYQRERDSTYIVGRKESCIVEIKCDVGRPSRQSGRTSSSLTAGWFAAWSFDAARVSGKDGR